VSAPLHHRIGTSARRALHPTGLGRWPSSRENRERFLRVARDFIPYLVVERDGQFLILATDDPTHGKLFTRGKRKEQAILPRALDYLERSGVQVARKTFVDVGANVGTTTFAALQAGFSPVVACEPLSSNVRILRANLVLNGVEDSVVPLELALSNHSGTATIDTAGGSRKARVLQPDELPRGPSQEIRLARLDDLVADGVLDPNDVGFLFIDAEGHECQILEGASRLLQADVPLVMEVNPQLLRLAGKIGSLTDLLGLYYTHFLDLRTKSGRTFEPVDRLGVLIDQLKGSATDILACRLPADA
jgi:FkbM family methyltransferase